MSDTHTASRREDLRLITGRGRYASDWNLPGQLHAAFLRSDRAHAEIVSVNAAPALERPGVVAVFTGADAIAAGYTRFPLMANFTNRKGASLLKPERPVLAHGKVRFVGEAVALVVAESALAAHDALDAIEIEYRELSASVHVDDALASSASQLHVDVPGNLSLEWEAGDDAAVAKAFEQAAHVTRIKIGTTRVVASPMEPRSYVVSYDAAAASYDVYTSAQGISLLREQIATLTGVPAEKLRLHLRDVGGSFGQRSGVYPEHAALMIATKKLGRPVKWVSTRSEGFLSDAHGRAIQMSGELALDHDGRFLAARYEFTCDMGAYLTPGGPSGHLRNVAKCMTGVYRTPALYGAWKVVFTNAAPISAYRGAGRPDIAYVVERLVDKAASELKIDRAELRRRNFIPLDAFPYKSPTGGVYELSDFAGCLDKALPAADWAGFERRREAARKAGKLRGIGLAVVIEGTGAGQYPQDQVALEFDAQGKLSIYTTTLSGGQGHETTFAAVVAQTLGVAPEAVTLRESVLGKEIIGNNTGGSRALVATGSVCKLAAQKLIERARPLAAEALELEPSQLEYGEGAFRSRDCEKVIGLLDLAQKHISKNPHPLNLIAEGAFGSTFPNGCHIAEVEIDPDTGVTEIVSYVAVDDCGNVINHSIVEGQVHGGVTQGAGQVFGEHAVYDRDSGQLLTGSFSDYYMPRAGLIREIHLSEHPVPSKLNVLGAKGVGESGCTASLPTLANATMDALRPLGIQDLDMPFTPSKVWHAIQAAKVK
ncbi:MAG: xanthine dehydrogenase family protein molybdopterin-binding subunit [Betaproteobacteria bacterium]|nr:xanthine dehydrogenase family protein molybdopterin-binding subunit [Betaproteobacteria bacterium]